MIPLEDRKKLLKALMEGKNMNEAIKAAKIPKASLYRLFQEEPQFKTLCDEAMETYKKTSEEKNMEALRNMIRRK